MSHTFPAALSRSPRRRTRPPSRFVPSIETLEGRDVPAVIASFSPADGLLNVMGDGQDDVIVLARDAAGAITVNGGAVPIAGGTPTVANTVQIQVFGQAGNDHISLVQTNGRLPATQVFGQSGNDTLVGALGNHQLFGGDGDDAFRFAPAANDPAGIVFIDGG